MLMLTISILTGCYGNTESNEQSCKRGGSCNEQIVLKDGKEQLFMIWAKSLNPKDGGGIREDFHSNSFAIRERVCDSKSRQCYKFTFWLSQGWARELCFDNIFVDFVQSSSFSCSNFRLRLALQRAFYGGNLLVLCHPKAMSFSTVWRIKMTKNGTLIWKWMVGWNFWVENRAIRLL